MAKKKTKEKEEVFYVGVQDPVEVRRNLLEASKDMVQFLQQHEKLKSVRDEKTEAIKHLREDVRELKTMINKLRRALPQTKLRIKLHEEHQIFKCEKCNKELKSEKNLKTHLKTHVKHRQKKPVAVKPAKKTAKKAVKKAAKKPAPKETQTQLAEKPAPAKPKPPVEKPKPMTEIEKLESELADIEKKLGKLS